MRFRHPKYSFLAPLLVVALSGCGQDRTALAKKTVQDYWYDVGHLKLDQAYNLLSPGVQQTLTKSNYQQDLFGFLQNSNGISAQVSKADVVGDCALVSLGLMSPRAPGQSLKVQQHLYWINGGWRITDQDGTVSQRHETLKSCPTGG